MEKFYKLGPVTLCMRNWPRDIRWPFAVWKLDAYETGKADIDIEDSYIADVNGDNVVDILDATAIQKYAAV